MEIKEISLRFFFGAFARNWKMIAGAAVVSTALALVYCAYAPRTYISTVLLFPEENATPSLGALDMLSSSFGLAVGGSSQYSEMYRDVIKSRTFVRDLLDTTLECGDSSTTPARFYGLDSLEERRKVAGLSRKLNTDLGLTKLPNGMISLSLETTDPRFSASFLNAIVGGLEQFFEAKAQREADQSLEFMRAKIEEKEANYRASSDRLAKFLSENQYLDYQKTPRLFNRLEELKRDQRIQEEIYLLLVKEHEKSMIEKGKDKTLIHVLDYAEAPFQKEKPYRVKIVLAAFFGSLFLAYGWVLVRERLRAAA